MIQAALRDPQSEAERLKGALKACTLLGKTRGAGDRRRRRRCCRKPGLTAEAAIALSYMGPDAFAPLRDGLRSDDPIVRRESLRSIGKLKERAPLDAAPVVPLLIESMQDPDAGVRTVAATYLGIISSRAGAGGAGVDRRACRTRIPRSGAKRRPRSDRSAPPRPGAAGAQEGRGDSNEDVAREAGRAMLKLQQK